MRCTARERLGQDELQGGWFQGTVIWLAWPPREEALQVVQDEHGRSLVPPLLTPAHRT